MIRRRFLGLATFAGVAGLATLEGMNTTEQKTVAFRIAGFTCITCAVGLETLLLKEKGVVRAKASYPANYGDDYLSPRTDLRGFTREIYRDHRFYSYEGKLILNKDGGCPDASVARFACRHEKAGACGPGLFICSRQPTPCQCD